MIYFIINGIADATLFYFPNHYIEASMFDGDGFLNSLSNHGFDPARDLSPGREPLDNFTQNPQGGGAAILDRSIILQRIRNS
jgi:hypothetical protein